MIIKTIAIALIAFSLAACLGGKPFQPPPPTFEMWTKQGITKAEIKHAMLECGYPNPFGIDPNWSRNTIAAVQECMYEKGFKRLDGYRICSLKENKVLPACQPAIPHPGSEG